MTIVLDTDFVLNLLIKELDDSHIFKQVIHKLNKYGTKIIIPDQILEEVRKHAEYAHRSFTYFKSNEEQFDYEQIMYQIQNLFAKGYFKAKHDKVFEGDFNSYIENYFYKDNIDYVKSYIQNEICEKITFFDLKNIKLNSIDFSLLEQMISKVLSLTKDTFKASYRDEDENRLIAETDSRLFLDVCEMNDSNTHQENRILAKDYYVVTSATRAIRAAKNLRIYQDIYFSPLHLISLIEHIEPFDIQYDEVQNIFINPYLAYAIQESTDIVGKMLELGVDLKGQNLTRLKYDLGDTYEKVLQGDYSSKGLENENIEVIDEENELQLIVEDLKERNFKFITPIEKVIEKLSETRREMDITNKKVERLSHRDINIIKRRKKKLKKS